MQETLYIFAHRQKKTYLHIDRKDMKKQRQKRHSDIDEKYNDIIISSHEKSSKIF